MINYDKEAITDSTYKHVDAILKSNDYFKNKLRPSSGVMWNIVYWSTAMMQYYECLKVVNTKRAKVREWSKENHIELNQTQLEEVRKV